MWTSDFGGDGDRVEELRFSLILGTKVGGTGRAKASVWAAIRWAEVISASFFSASGFPASLFGDGSRGFCFNGDCDRALGGEEGVGVGEQSSR